jgi:hypothetical protein
MSTSRLPFREKNSIPPPRRTVMCLLFARCVSQFPLAAMAIAGIVATVAGCGGQRGVDVTGEPTAASPPGAADEEAIDGLKKYPNAEFNTSIVQILAKPERFHGKRVRIEGFLHVRFEGTAIYLCKEHAEHGMSRYGFEVRFDKSAIPYEGVSGPTQFDRKYVLIEGTFDKTIGHWQGIVSRVDRVVELEHHN